MDEYESSGTRTGLPPFAEAGAEARADAEARLVTAISLLVGGEHDAVASLSALAAAPDVESGIRSIAAILAGIALSDGGRPDLELSHFSTCASVTSAIRPRRRCLTSIGYSGLRSVASSTTLGRGPCAAGDSLEECWEPDLTIQITARHNSAQFTWLAQQGYPAVQPRRAESKAIVWVDLLAADALEDYLDGHFKAFFEQPFTRSVTFLREDQTDRGLSRSLFRAEAPRWTGKPSHEPGRASGGTDCSAMRDNVAGCGIRL